MVVGNSRQFVPNAELAQRNDVVRQAIIDSDSRLSSSDEPSEVRDLPNPFTVFAADENKAIADFDGGDLCDINNVFGHIACAPASPSEGAPCFATAIPGIDASCSGLVGAISSGLR